MPKKHPKTYCIAENCRNTDVNCQQFFGLPPHDKDPQRRRKWLTLLGREDLLDKTDAKRRVCPAHFDTSSIIITKKLKDGAIPTMFLAKTQQNESSSKLLSIPTQPKDTTIVLSKSTEGTSSNPHDQLSTEQCRFCGEFNADCVKVTSEKPYLVHNRTAITLNGLCVYLDFNTLPNAVCPHCDEKLHDIYNFVNQVKAVQDNLMNAEANRGDIKTEALSPTPEDDKEGLLDLVTVGETEFVKPVYSHKRKNDSKLNKPKDKLQKKLKVTEKNVELLIDVKEEVEINENTEEQIENSESQMENCELSDTGTGVKPSELELNSALHNKFSDSFS